MKTKKVSVSKMNKLRFVLVLLCSFVFILLAAVGTYAWFKNATDADGPKLQTGKINVQLTEYQKADDNSWKSNELFHSNTENPDSALLNTSEFLFDFQTKATNEIFFVVEKLDGSIDVDLSLSFILQGLEDNEQANAMQFAGGFYYKLTKLEDFNGEEITAYLNTKVGGNNAAPVALNKINADIVKARLSESDRYAIFCLTCGYINGASETGISNPYLNRTYKLTTKFSVGQIGSLDGEPTGTTHRVGTEEQLRNAINSYGSGDSIYLTADITYNADLILDHPVKFYVRGQVLKINGNFMISYADTGDFLIDTQGGGKIIVARVGQSGNFIVDTPNAYLEINGSGNEAGGKGDIYVENKMTVKASMNRGITFYRTFIYDTDTASANDLTTLKKDIYFDDATLITVGLRTAMGKLIAVENIRLSKIVNNGDIAHIDYSKMNLDGQDNPYTSPQIYFENYGNISEITLNANSFPCYREGKPVETTSANTRLIKKLGGTFENAQGAQNENIVKGCSKAQIYIETDLNIVYVEPMDAHVADPYTQIIVHYANRYDVENVEIADTTLKDVLAWWFDGVHASADGYKNVTKMKVVCYGDKQLTDTRLNAETLSDYEFIREMTKLEYLDLSECVSENSVVKSEAFSSLAKLEQLYLPEASTIENYALHNTAITEITIPSSYTTIGEYAFSNKDQTTSKIEYLHLSGFSTYDTVLPNAPTTSGKGMYVFVSSQDLVAQYRTAIENTELSTQEELNAKAHLFLEAEHVGDYFVRFVGDATVEIATYVGETFDYATENSPVSETGKLTNFDFSKFTRVDESIREYVVVSFDDYAFYNKLVDTTEFDLTMNGTEAIGAYAFSDASAVLTIAITSNNPLKISEYAFYETTATTLSINSKSVYIAPNAFEESNASTLTVTTTGLVEIATNAFKSTKATGTAPITIKAGDVQINEKAFYDAQSTSLTVEGKTVVIGKGAFETSSTSALDITADAVEISEQAFNYTNETTTPDAIVIHATGAVNIGTHAFASTQATRLYIEADSVTVDHGAFAFPEDSGQYNHVSGNGYNLIGTREVKLKEVNIQSKTVSIGAWAFRRCSSITNVNLSGEGTISTSGFYRCMSLQEVIAPNITKVEDYAFGMHSMQGEVGALKAVKMPSLVDMGEYVFVYQPQLAYLETSIVYKIKGTQQTASKTSHKVATNSIRLYKVVPNGMDVSSYNFVPSLFKTSGDGPYDMHVLVPNEYQAKYVNSKFGATTDNSSSKLSYVIPNENYLGGEGYMWNENGEWVSGPAYTIDYEAKTFEMAHYAYVLDANGDVQILANLKTDITEELALPESVKINGASFKVSSVGPFAFRNAKIEVESVTIGDNITYLDADAFAPQYHSSDIKKGRSAQRIDIGALTSLKGFIATQIFTDLSISYPELYKGKLMFKGVTEVTGTATAFESATFKGITNLKGVRFPNVTTLSDQEFYGCTDLTTADFPSLTSISGYAFKNCTSLVNPIMPELTSVSGGAFQNTGLETLTDETFPNLITIADGTKTGDGVFSNCAKLETVNFSESSKLTSVGDYSFSGCTSLENVHLAKVTDLGVKPFEGNTKPFSVSLDALVTLNPSSFQENAYLRGIYCPKITTLNNAEFSGCTSLSYAEFAALTSVGNAAFKDCAFTELTDAMFPVLTEINGTGSSTGSATDDGDIFNGPFCGCDELTSIELPNVTKIGYFAFVNCTSSYTAKFDSLTTIENYAFGKRHNSTKSLSGKDWTNNGITSLDAPKLTTIGDYAFCGADKLTKISTKNVTALGTYALFSCGSLTKLDLSSLTTVNAYSMRYCSELKSVYAPNVTMISGSYAFANTALTNVNGEDDDSRLYAPLVGYIDGVSDESLGNSTFYNCQFLIKVKLEHVGRVGTSCFEGCTALQEVHLDSAAYANNNAFYGCTSLEHVEAPMLTNIADRAFQNCSSLEYIYFPALEKAESNAFNGCTALKSAYLSSFKGSAEKSVFSGCSNLVWIYMPEASSEMSASWLDGCTSLKVAHFGKATNFTYLQGKTSLCVIFEDGNLTTPTEIASTVIVKGANAGNYLAAQGYSRAEVNDVSEQILFVDANGEIITYDDLFTPGSKVERVPVAVYVKENAPEGALTLLRADTVSVEESGNFTVAGTVGTSSVKAVASYAFGDVACNIETLSFGDSIRTVGDNIFATAENVTVERLELNNVQSLGAFPVSWLTSVTGTHLTTLTSEGTFENCTDLEHVSLPNLQAVPARTFYGCEKLKTVDVTAATSIGVGAFNGCAAVETLVFPNVTSVTGDNDTPVFGVCLALASVSFGKELTSVTGALFDESCTALTMLLVENDATVVNFTNNLSDLPTGAKLLVAGKILSAYYAAEYTEEKVASYQTSTTECGITYYFDKIANGELSIAYMVSAASPTALALVSETVQDAETWKVVAISRQAMQVLSEWNIVTLTLPKHLKYFTDKELLPTSLTAFIMPTGGDALYETDDNGVLYNKGKTMLVAYPKASAATTFAVPTTVTVIADKAFYGALHLQTVTVQNAAMIMSGAFAYSNIETIDLTAAQVCTFIGEDIIAGCKADLKIRIPTSLASAYEQAVYVDQTIASRFSS